MEATISILAISAVINAGWLGYLVIKNMQLHARIIDLEREKKGLLTIINTAEAKHG